VDIDSQAVEVTKLSLLLKVLENESREGIEQQLKMFKERALPNIDGNIKCGNSLIGPDFYDGEMDLGDEERKKINAFDWKREFPEIMKRGGFDVVIGNPPWGGDVDKIIYYLQMHYPDSTKSYRDTFKLFIERGLILTRQNGIFSLIIPSAFMIQPRYIDVRRLLIKYNIRILWNLGDKVFGPKVVAPCAIFVVMKRDSKSDSFVSILDTSQLTDNIKRAKVSQAPIYQKLHQSVYEKTTEETFTTFYREMGKKEVKLEEILDCKDCGIKHQRVGCGLEEKGKSDLASRLYYEGKRKSTLDKKYLIGADLNINGWYVEYSNERYFKGSWKEILRKNEIVYFNEKVFDLPLKIVWRQTSDRIRAAIIKKCWFANTLQAGILLDNRYDLRYILGILNSKYLNHIYLETVKEGGRVFPQVKMSKVRALPFRTIDFADAIEKTQHDKMRTLVEQMLTLYKQLTLSKTPNEKETIARQIYATDQQIDRLVYELYGLTEEEIKVVEGG